MAKSSYEGLANIRNSMEDILAQMLVLKREGKEGKGSVQLRELVTEASVLFVDLRQVNRLILQEEDRVKLETEAAKAPVDQTTLQLHNLLYEKNYYLKAIKACKDFKSKYPDIDLVPTEEFFQDAQEEMLADPALKDDPHKLMLQRLNLELHQRKELLKLREVVESRKKLLQENIANRRKFLGSLPSHLKALKKASLPVQQQLGLFHTKRMKQHTLAELLPPPLYILYTQLLSHKEAFGEALELEIIGSAKDAQALARQLALKDARGVLDEGKTDEEVPEEEDDSQRRRKRAKKSHDKEAVEGDSIYQAHPLAVIAQIFDDEQRATKLLNLRFEYLSKLNALCAGVEGTSHGGGDPGTLLANLFPDDTGVDLPNQIAKLQAGAGFTFDKKRPLRPYKWVQHLGGIDILPESPPLLHEKDGGINGDGPKVGGSTLLATGLAAYRQQHRVNTILQQLRVRRKAQLALKDQLDSLAKLKCPLLKSHPLPWTLHTPKATLRNWVEVDRTSLKPSSSSFHSLTMVSSQLASPMDTTLLIEAPPQVGEGGLTGGAAMTEGEAGKEDGELPSSGPIVVPPGDGSGVTPAKGSPGVSGENGTKAGVEGSGLNDAKAPGAEKETVKANVASRGGPSSKGVPSKQALQGPRKISSHTEKNSSKGVEKVLDGFGLGQKEGIMAELGGLDALMDEDMVEGIEEFREDLSEESTQGKGQWEGYGMRSFQAVLRRENGPSGKRVELEAQVDISVEYPIRPPIFQLHLLSGHAIDVNLPPAPGGTLDVTEGAVNKAITSIDHCFNDLRAIEAEVNISVSQILPKADQNHTLAHQISMLMMLFDRHVDFEHEPVVGYSHAVSEGLSTADFSSEKVGSVRTLRGRDRRKMVAWTLEGGTTDRHS